MRKINWYGNNGHCFPAPGTVKAAECGVCGTEMNVRRNVLGPTSSAEAMAGRKHRHDSFACPHVAEDWHKRIDQLKFDFYLEMVVHRNGLKEDPRGYKKMRRAA